MAFPQNPTANPAMPVWSDKLIPVLWSRKLLERFYDATVLGSISQTDYQGEIRNQGDTVRINRIPDITINPYAAGDVLVYQRPPASTIDLNIDQGFYWAFQIDDVMDVQSVIKMMGPYADNASERLKIAVDTDVLTFMVDKAAPTNRGATAGARSGNINLGTTAAPLQITPDNIIDTIVDIGQAFDENNIPESNRKLVLPAWMTAMIRKSDIRDANITGDNVGTIRSGRIGVVNNMEVFMSNLLPTTTGITTCYGVNPLAVTFAAQLTKTEQLRAESTFGDLMRGLMVYGRQVVEPLALVQIVAEKA